MRQRADKHNRRSVLAVVVPTHCEVAKCSNDADNGEDGSGGRDRTYDQLINSQLLYR